MDFTGILSDLASQLTLRAALDILLVAVGVYFALRLLRNARALQSVVVILLLIGLYQVAREAQLEMVEWILASVAPYAAIALVVLFQPEIRRVLAGLARNLTPARLLGTPATAVFDDVILAAGFLSENRNGALIVFEREAALHTYIESGIPLDAHVSYDLLLAIFRPGSPLHDGAVIIQGTRIAAAACFLPLYLKRVF
jgi:diadenylate cyclase